MIRSPLRAGLALACALSLSACGGSDGNLYVGGTVTGNTKAGLAVTNNGGPRLDIPAGATNFVFPDLIETDKTYNVQVVASPDNTKPSTPGGTDGCKVVNGTGTGKAVFNVTTVRIVCTLQTYPLSARILGPHPGNLELVNGPDRKVVAPTDQTVQMAEIPEDAVYGLAVLKSEGQTCTIANGSGKMTTAGKTVDVTCTTP
jgi:hypothetical protein